MIQFEYVITDELGIHARPAGLLIREAKKYSSMITLLHGNRTSAATKLFEIMKLGIKQADTLGITIEGPDEEESAAAIREVLKTHL